MPYETIAAEVRDGVGHLTLQRPDAGNAIDLTMAQELLDAATRWSVDPMVRVVLLRGAGTRFCVGGDLRSFAGFTGSNDLPRHLLELTSHLHAAISRLARLDAPIVAAVQGSAAGAGFSLACSADLVLVGASARFVMAYTAVGLSPDGSATWFLPRAVGARRAMELTLTNRAVGAEDAVAWGLATRVVPDDELDAASLALASELAAGPMPAMGNAKRLLRASLGNDLEQQMELESLALAEAAGSADGQEGIAAFVAKRPPAFGAAPGGS